MDHIQSWVDAEEVRRMAESLMDPASELEVAEDDTAYGDDFEGFANTSPLADKGEKPEQSKPVRSPLAQAYKVAKGSGMLRQADQLQNPVAPEKLNSEPVQDSPFRVSSHQDPTDDVPMAREVPPAVESGPVTKKPEAQIQDQAEQVEISTSVEESTSSFGPSAQLLEKFSLIIREQMGARAMLLVDHDGDVIFDEVKNPKLIQVVRTLVGSFGDTRQQPSEGAAIRNLHVKIGTDSTLEVVLVRVRSELMVLGVLFDKPLGVERATQLAERFEEVLEEES